MLVLSETDMNKAFQPQDLKPGSEETNKARMVDTESEDGEEETEKSSRTEAVDVLHKACASLNEEEMDLKKKKLPAPPEDKEVEKGGEDVDINKALRAIAVAGMTRRERLDAAYQLGVAQGRQVPRVVQEPVKLTNLNVGSTHARPAHEPPVVPVRCVEAPQAAPRPDAQTESCLVHGYVHKSGTPCTICEQSVVREAGPFWRR
jgi:hypothetical protein